MNYTTEHGRIDFAFETKEEILIVELETGMCILQMENGYPNLARLKIQRS